MQPLETVRAAEMAALMPGLGRWVQQRAIATVASIPAQQGTSLMVSVNVSPLEMEQETFAVPLTDMLRAGDLLPSHFEINITESTLIEGSDEVHENLQALTTVGVRIAIDNFGSGHAALHCITSHPLNTIKLDGRLVQSIGTDNATEMLTFNVIALARQLGVTPVAETVIADEQLPLLKAAGCLEMNGWRFSPPLSEGDLASLLSFTRFSAASPSTRPDTAPRNVSPSQPTRRRHRSNQT
jgi:EAL domain-containing protein (putative c-di-GMP-specific phosphodiesterase class I)